MISTALFDLNAEEIAEIQAMEDAADEAATKPEEESNLDGFTPIDLSADMTELIKAAEEEAKA